ncbi:chromate transporter [Clostridium oceanicum]|uniref:Chromate transporter n=1 Tax=Clostridium oceanicum TaxID=1543 RepID=A0ABN1JER1_9CLOT
MKKLLLMFLTFFKIGAFTFGGGYAMIPLIEEEIVKRRDWMSKEEFLDIVVISQSFPGALAINSSIFIGYKIGGLKGAILSLLGVVIPSFTIILLIASLFMQFRNNYYVDLVFKGIGAAVPVLVLTGVISLGKALNKNIVTVIIVIVSCILTLVFKVHPVIIILVSAIYGIIFLQKKVK